LGIDDRHARRGLAARAQAQIHAQRRHQRRQSPRSRLRQYVLYTHFQGGKSFGNCRHWQPVFST